jgi:DNA-binding CsgD family transcriptional regulator
MSPTPEQRELFVIPSAVPHMVFVNERVSFQTEDQQRMILVQGVVFAHYSLEDHTAEAYSPISLFESGYADQNDLARGFGYSPRTLRRYQERLKAAGLSSLSCPRGRPSGSSAQSKPLTARDRTILHLKAKAMSNRWIGGQLGLSEKTIRKSLRRLGWQLAPDPAVPLFPEADSPASPPAVSKRSANPVSPAQPPSPKTEQRNRVRDGRPTAWIQTRWIVPWIAC